MNFLNYNHQEPHYETFIWKSLSIISEVILSGAFDPSTMYEIIPPLFEKVKDIIDLWYNNDASMQLVFPIKDRESLFETAGLFIMQISTHILKMSWAFDQPTPSPGDGSEHEKTPDNFYEITGSTGEISSNNRW